MRFSSYWMDTAPTFSGGATAYSPRYDVAIVGGGFTGLSAARVLAKAGKRVAVLEAGHLGSGASGRNGGHLNNGMAHGFGAAIQRFGQENARKLYQTYDAAIDLIEAVIADESIDCDFRRSGKLKFASKPGHVERLRADFDLIHANVDGETRFLGREELAGEIQTDAAFAGIIYEKSAMMHMGRYLVGLAEAAKRHGADIFQQQPVTARHRQGTDWVLGTPGGPVTARDVIVATGAYGGQTGPAFPEFQKRIIPVGSFILATCPLSDRDIAETVPGQRTYVNTLNVGSYFRLSPDRRLIFGGRARFSSKSDPASDAVSARILRRNLENMFPALQGIDSEFCFGGLVDMTRDRLPRAGQFDGVWYAMGYSGHGAQISSLLGAQIGNCLLGKAETPLDFLDWPVIRGYRGKPWFLPATGLWFRLKDAFL
jgi:glycine/D-amino acid oxidase-like deaminating enzyme